MIRLLSAWSAVILLLVTARSLTAQESYEYLPGADAAFDSAMARFRHHDFAAAVQMFDTLAAQRPVHQRTTASEIMAGKSLFELKEFRKSAAQLSGFLRRYPYSEYADDARYSIALDYLMLQAYSEAAVQLMHCVALSPDKALGNRAIHLFRTIAAEHLSEGELKRLLDQQPTSASRDLVAIALANKLYSLGRNSQISPVLEQVLLRNPRSSYADEALAIQQDITRGAQRIIGIILPLMKNSGPNPLSSLSSEMLDGMIYAVKESRPNGTAAWIPDVEVRDSQRDSAATLAVIRSMAADTNTLAVIGPLFSNLAALCAPVAEKAGLPLITPTASADGIAGTGRHIFQLTPDYTTRGRLMARYAVGELGAATVAILGTADQMGRSMAAGFAAEARRLGAKVIEQQFFPAGTTDLRDQFVAIRAAGLAAGRGKGSAENNNDPVTSIAAVYVPLTDASDIGVIASQMSYYNIRTQILGSNEWYDAGQLNSNRRYLDGMLFTSDWYIDEGDPAVATFRQEFSSRMRRTPTRYTFIGYDAMKLLLVNARSGATRRESLTGALGRVKDFAGLHLPVTLEGGRVNSSIHILKFEGGEIRHIRVLKP